jgi:Arc/MetJ family transcription regulator
MSANQDAPIKVVSVRVKRELWAEICRRAEVLDLKTQEAIEIALKSYLFIPIEDELNARKEGEDAFYNSLRDLKPKRSKDLQV